MNGIFEIIRNFFINLNPLWVYLIVVLVGLFIYWRGCTETRKNRSSIFDTFFLSIVVGSVVSTVIHAFFVDMLGTFYHMKDTIKQFISLD